jgi:ribose 5-phosphate isomerase B
MGSQVTGLSAAQKLIDIWLESEYQSGRSAPRAAKIEQLDERFRPTSR